MLSGEELLDCSQFSCTLVRLKSSGSTAWLSRHIQGGALASAVREMEEAVLCWVKGFQRAPLLACCFLIRHVRKAQAKMVWLSGWKTDYCPLPRYEADIDSSEQIAVLTSMTGSALPSSKGKIYQTVCVTVFSFCAACLLASHQCYSRAKAALWWQILELFFVTSIEIICKDTKQREREDSDADRRGQGVCLFALIAAMDVLGH